MKRPFITRLVTSKVWLPLLAGATAFQINISGCDPEVRDTVLTGLQTSITGLFSSVITAFFLSLQDAAESTTSQPVVKAIFEGLTSWLA